MTIPTVCSAVLLSVMIVVVYKLQCYSTSIIPACKNVTIPPRWVDRRTITCLKDSCTKNCVCSSPSAFDACNNSMVCHTNSSCYQIVRPGSFVPFLYCYSSEQCRQIVSNASSLQMIAESNVTNQVHSICSHATQAGFKNRSGNLKLKSKQFSDTKSFVLVHP